MDNYIMLEGKKIPLTDEQVNILKGTIEQPKKSPFERVYHGSRYYLIHSDGEVCPDVDFQSPTDDHCYEVANYCTDETLMKQRALHETLNRLLWRFSIENGEGENPWDNEHRHYEICYITVTEHLESYAVTDVKGLGAIHFPSKELAQRAIDEIIKPFMKDHPDFVW